MLDKIHFHEFGIEDFNLGDMSLEFNKLNVFVGQNGAGKTMIFKAAWFMSFTLQLYKTMQLLNIPNIDAEFRKEANIVFDMTWTSSEKVSGAIMIEDKNAEIFGYSAIIVDGKVDSFNINVLDIDKFAVGEVQQVSYNTKDARTFTQYEQYLKLKKRFGIDSFGSVGELEEFKDFYRLYDILWFEKVKANIDTHVAGTNPNMDRVLSMWDDIMCKDYYGKDVGLPLGADFVFMNSMIYINNDKTTMKPLSDYDAGTQSMIMMSMFAS